MLQKKTTSHVNVYNKLSHYLVSLMPIEHLILMILLFKSQYAEFFRIGTRLCVVKSEPGVFLYILTLYSYSSHAFTWLPTP